jgi:cytochrome c-type biogenesis protein CcmH
MGTPRSRLARWGIWAALAVVALIALIVGTRGDASPPTAEQRAISIASRIKCPTCEGLSVAQSKAGTSRAIYGEILRRVDAGEGRGEILSYIRSRYGTSEFLIPARTGLASVVWVLPVVAVVVAFAGLFAAFRRWRPGGDALVTDDDRALVERARRTGPEGPGAAPEDGR